MRSTYRIKDIDRNLRKAGFWPLDVLVVGGTGAGKSSTINMLFERKEQTVGEGCEPETREISPHTLNKLIRFWDTPGLGDSVERDRDYALKLADILHRDYYLEGKQYGLIDMVLVILDGSGRDMGTTYQLLNEVIVPNFQKDRIVVAVNQADMAMKGRHWNYVKNEPDEILYGFLEEKSDSVRRRVKEGTGVTIKTPVYYSAEKEFHVEKFLDSIIDNMPGGRRPLVCH